MTHVAIFYSYWSNAVILDIHDTVSWNLWLLALGNDMKSKDADNSLPSSC